MLRMSDDLTTCLSPGPPLEKVDVKVVAHFSPYHGNSPFSEALPENAMQNCSKKACNSYLFLPTPTCA